MRKYFQLLVEGKREDDWGAYFANLKKTITPYGKQFVHVETGKIVTTGPTDSQHYDIVSSNLNQFGFHNLKHMADTVNAHNANTPKYSPLTTDDLGESRAVHSVVNYLQDHGWAHVTHQASDKRPTTYIRTADHKSAQRAIEVMGDQLLPEVSIETNDDVSELRSKKEIYDYRTSSDPSALFYTSRNTIETRQPTDAEKYATDDIIRSTTPEWQRAAESFTFSKLRTQLVESWQEYDVKVGESNRSLFEPNNKNFNMKHFLKKLRKKFRVSPDLPGENQVKSPY